MVNVKVCVRFRVRLSVRLIVKLWIQFMDMVKVNNIVIVRVSVMGGFKVKFSLRTRLRVSFKVKIKT